MPNRSALLTPDLALGTTPGSTLNRTPSTVDITLTREGQVISAVVRTRPGAPTRLAAYWTVTEDGHHTAVKSGENQGATLQHDFVVRAVSELPAWTAPTGVPTPIRFDLAGAVSPAHPASINMVVTDATTHRPLQALRLGC